MGPGGMLVGPGGMLVGPRGMLVGPGGMLVGPGGMLVGRLNFENIISLNIHYNYAVFVHVATSQQLDLL